jgi:gamma-glutamylcyclotransferase (GGCT)/AIG2-like uncharacterized protein YtfP
MFHLLAKHARYLGEASVHGRLFDLGEYPGMIPDDRKSVVGEVYEVDPRDWDTVIRRLDEYEGCGPIDPPPHEYRREIVNARLSHGGAVLTAWAYVLNRAPSETREIRSGDYISWREGAAR